MHGTQWHSPPLFFLLSVFPYSLRPSRHFPFLPRSPVGPSVIPQSRCKVPRPFFIPGRWLWKARSAVALLWHVPCSCVFCSALITRVTSLALRNLLPRPAAKCLLSFFYFLSPSCHTSPHPLPRPHPSRHINQLVSWHYTAL